MSRRGRWRFRRRTVRSVAPGLAPQLTYGLETWVREQGRTASLAERGGFSSGPTVHPIENSGNPHTLLKIKALTWFPFRLSGPVSLPGTLQRPTPNRHQERPSALSAGRASSEFAAVDEQFFGVYLVSIGCRFHTTPRIQSSAWAVLHSCDSSILSHPQYRGTKFMPTFADHHA